MGTEWWWGLGGAFCLGVAVGRRSCPAQTLSEVEGRLRAFLERHLVTVRAADGQPVPADALVRAACREARES